MLRVLRIHGICLVEKVCWMKVEVKQKEWTIKGRSGGKKRDMAIGGCAHMQLHNTHTCNVVQSLL